MRNLRFGTTFLVVVVVVFFFVFFLFFFSSRNQGDANLWIHGISSLFSPSSIFSFDPNKGKQHFLPHFLLYIFILPIFNTTKRCAIFGLQSIIFIGIMIGHAFDTTFFFLIFLKMSCLKKTNLEKSDLKKLYCKKT